MDSNAIGSPHGTLDSRPYWEGCQRGELLFQRCDACGEPVFHPRALCPYCMADRLVWERSCGRGWIYSFTLQHVHLQDDGAPVRALGIVALEERYHMFTEILATDLGEVRVDAPVAVEFGTNRNGLVLPRFRVQT